MNRVRRLVQSYARHVSTPWRPDAAAAQRVICCVYSKTDERALRAGIGEFEVATLQAGHEWALFDVTDTFAVWLSSQRYARKYFQDPDPLDTLLPRYLTFLTDAVAAFIQEKQCGSGCVVALGGVGSLFGLLKVSEVVEKLAPLVEGRLLVFFPGSCEGDNYRLLDGYDGWNYHAVLITANQD